MMGGETQNMGGLSQTLEQQSKLPLYGATSEQLQELKDAQQKALEALEARYAQPNWFKVAAGFAKPQLGGFLASLGSASEALGENVEQQRAQQLPIAQMRAQLAQTNLLMGQNKTVSDMLAERKAKNLPITPEFVREVTARFPESSIAKALASEIGYTQKQQELTNSQYRNDLDMAWKMRQSGEIDEATYRARLRELQTLYGRAGMSDMPPSEPQPGVQKTPVDTGVPTNAGGGAETKPTSTTGKDPIANFVLSPSFSSKDLKLNPVTEDEKAFNASIRARADKLEEIPTKQFQNLQIFKDANTYHTAHDAAQGGLDLIDSDKKTAHDVTAIIRQAGFFPSLFAGGVGLHVGPYGASISLEGLEPALIAKLDEPKQKYLDALLNYMAKSTYYDLVSRGIRPETEGADKFRQLMMQEMSSRQSAEAIRYGFATNKHRLEHNQKLLNILSKHLPSASKISFSPLHDLFQQHPEVLIENGVLAKKLEKERRDYQRALGGAQ
jgi:hypothetical protein